MAQSIVENVARGGFNADLSRANTAFGQPFFDDRVRALVFLPNAEFDRPAHLLAQAAFLKGRSNQQWISLARNQKSEDALAGPPADAGVIDQRRSGSNVKSFETRLGIRHQLLRVCDAGLQFFGADWLYAITEGLQGVKRGRQ